MTGTAVRSSIWLRQRKLGMTGLELGIVGDTNVAVEPHATNTTGGADAGAPAARGYFAPGWYAANANVADLDGNRPELVHKARKDTVTVSAPEGSSRTLQTSLPLSLRSAAIVS